MMKEGAGTNYATKVVPIVSIGNKGYIGAAQVIGDADQVEKVKAVGQLEIIHRDVLSVDFGALRGTGTPLRLADCFGGANQSFQWQREGNLLDRLELNSLIR